MGIAERLRRLEDRAKCHVPSYDLFADMKRYEAIFEAIEAGSSLDIEDPDVQTCLEYERYFAELEATRVKLDNLDKRIQALESKDPLVLRWLFPPNGVPRSQVKFTWIKENMDEA